MSPGENEMLPDNGISSLSIHQDGSSDNYTPYKEMQNGKLNSLDVRAKKTINIGIMIPSIESLANKERCLLVRKCITNDMDFLTITSQYSNTKKGFFFALVVNYTTNYLLR